MLEYELTLDSALRILLDANNLSKNGKFPLAIYLAHVSKDYFKKCENELGISLCDDLIDNGIIDIKDKVYLRIKKKGGRITPNRLERAIASSEEVVELSLLMTDDVFEDDSAKEIFYSRLIKGNLAYSIKDIPFENN